MTTKRKTVTQDNAFPGADELELLEDYREKARALGRHLDSYDIYGVYSEVAHEAFWDELVALGEAVTVSYRQIVALKGGSGEGRILKYLKAHVGEVVPGTTLAAVAGISEWARRVRELDVEHGYRISTNETDPSLRIGEYRLDALEPDRERADWWQLKSRLRRDREMSMYQKILALLLARVGKAVDGSELEYVTKNQDYVRWIEELQHQGQPISTSVNRPDLRPGQYLLEQL